MSKPTPPSVRERSCTQKVRFECFATAADAGTVRMATDAAVPLYVYECRFCQGFHLTSSTRWSGTMPLQPIVAPINPSTMSMTGRKPSTRPEVRAALTKTHRKRKRCAVDAEERENRLDVVLPRPHVATRDEMDAFFAKHGGPAFASGPTVPQPRRKSA